MLAAAAVLAVFMVYTDAKLQAKFDGVKWTLPARVYSRALMLYPDMPISRQQLEAELEWTDYRYSRNLAAQGIYNRRGEHWIIKRRAFDFWDGPETERRIEFDLRGGKIRDLRVNGKAAALARLEPQYLGGIFPTHHEDRELINLDEVPPALVGALVATEDRDFFKHFGISVRGIARAMVVNFQAGRVVQGGSTLTQQLIKNMYLTEDRTLIRKAEEAMMAVLLETHYSKREILQAYLNEVYLGQSGRRSIHGVGLAARFYFGKPAQELNLPEIATLVGLIKGASYYNPKKHPERARERRDLVLTLMAEQGVISEVEMRQAQATPMVTADSLRAGQREYPAFLELVRSQLQNEYRRQDLETEGLKVFTTLNPWLQQALESSAQRELVKLERGHAELDGKLETGAVFTSVDGGEVLAIIGSREPRFFGFNRALNTRRSIGSLAKPVVYLSALESGKYHWGTRIDDSPVSVSGPNGQIWQPRNADGLSHGSPMMLDALTHSYNQATARLGMRVGLNTVASTFKRLGLLSDVPVYPSILLGSMELSPFNVASMYQTIAAQGFVMPLRTVHAVTTAEGNTLSSYAIEGEQVFDALTMQWLRYGLEQVVNKGTAKRLGYMFSDGQANGRLAGKTGTSDKQRDAWFAGFDDRYLGVVWVGRDDNKPIPFYGGTAALPIWRATMEQVAITPLQPSQALVWREVNEEGKLLPAECEGDGLPLPFLSESTEAEVDPSECKESAWWLKSLFGVSDEDEEDADMVHTQTSRYEDTAEESDWIPVIAPVDSNKQAEKKPQAVTEKPVQQAPKKSQPSDTDNQWLRELF